MYAFTLVISIILDLGTHAAGRTDALTKPLIESLVHDLKVAATENVCLMQFSEIP